MKNRPPRRSPEERGRNGYHGSRHQAYVDGVMAGLKPQQRRRVGQLWKEKRRFDPKMTNPGASFVRILTYVAGGVGNE